MTCQLLNLNLHSTYFLYLYLSIPDRYLNEN